MEHKFVFSFKRITAREISEINQMLKASPEASIERFASLLAKTIVDAPEAVTGPYDEADTWLDLPFWADNEDDLCFQDCVEALNQAMERLGKTSKSG